jgi:hypothetical protein
MQGSVEPRLRLATVGGAPTVPLLNSLPPHTAQPHPGMAYVRGPLVDSGGDGVQVEGTTRIYM